MIQKLANLIGLDRSATIGILICTIYILVVLAVFVWPGWGLDALPPRTCA